MVMPAAHNRKEVSSILAPTTNFNKGHNMNIKDEISLQVEILRELGVDEPLTIVPVVNKRCIIPCAMQHCNCVATIAGRFALVTESKKRSCIEDATREIETLNRILNEDSPRDL